MPPLDVRLRVTSPELLALPWERPLRDWSSEEVPLVELPVGPSRHLVRFVLADRRLWALKALPHRTVAREYDVLRRLEHRALAAVRPAGVVIRPSDEDGVLVTHYLEGSWQYRRLLSRVPPGATLQRGRLLDALAILLVDLHRNGVYWGDCSLPNTLFRRDGQGLSAWMVDAETSELHPSLSDGQRTSDVEVMVENVMGGLLDVAADRGDPPETTAQVVAEVDGLARRYEELWSLLHHEPVVVLGDRTAVSERVRALNELGFAVDEVRLEPDAESRSDPEGRMRVKASVAGRIFHHDVLRSLTGLEVGEGQATILVRDLDAHRRARRDEPDVGTDERDAAGRWLVEVFGPGTRRAHEALGGRGDPVQAYCDLLEVRWLLSEEAGHDVGDEVALDALARRRLPAQSSAELGFVDLDTAEVPVVVDEPG